MNGCLQTYPPQGHRLTHLGQIINQDFCFTLDTTNFGSTVNIQNSIQVYFFCKKLKSLYFEYYVYKKVEFVWREFFIFLRILSVCFVFGSIQYCKSNFQEQHKILLGQCKIQVILWRKGGNEINIRYWLF